MGRQGEWAMHQLSGVDVLKRGGGQYGGGIASAPALIARAALAHEVHPPPHARARAFRGSAASEQSRRLVLNAHAFISFEIF